MLRVLKRAIKNALPSTDVDLIYWIESMYGMRYAVTAYAASRFRRGRLIRMPVPDSSHSVLIRPVMSDQMLYENIFIRREYGTTRGDPRFIIDAGGHIGMAAVFFAARFPRAKLAIIEPDARNFELLKRNVGRLPNVTLYRGGLWSHKATLDIANPHDDPWSYQMREGRGVPGYTVDEILQAEGEERVGLLKVDVEGAEVEVFSTATAWIDRVDQIAIELHDRFRPGCREALDKAIAGHGFAKHAFGENTILIRESRTLVA